MSTYISGPMSPESFGLTEAPDAWDYNFPAFNQFADVYARAGHDVVNPADHGMGDHPYDWYLREAIKALADCDHIVMLPGWVHSKGAVLEHQIGEALGMEITYLEAS